MSSSQLETAPIPSEQISIDEAIKSTSQDCLARYGIKINRSACEQFLTNLERSELDKGLESEPESSMKFPLKFSSPLDELNVVAMVSLLDGFHSYEGLLKNRTGRGVWETMRYLVLAAYLSPASQSTSILTTDGMVGVKAEELGTMLSLPLHHERPIAENSPISLAEPDLEVARFLDELVGLLHSTGHVLQLSGLPNLASFLATRSNLNTDQLVRQLLGAFPGFRDMYILDSQPIYLLKKPISLVRNIQKVEIKFPNLTWPKITAGEAFLPVALVQLGLLDFTSCSESSLRGMRERPMETDLKLSARAATILRAATLACCLSLLDLAQSLADSEPSKKSSLDLLEHDRLLRYLTSLGRLRSNSYTICEHSNVLY